MCLARTCNLLLLEWEGKAWWSFQSLRGYHRFDVTRSLMPRAKLDIACSPGTGIRAHHDWSQARLRIICWPPGCFVYILGSLLPWLGSISRSTLSLSSILGVFLTTVLSEAAVFWLNESRVLWTPSSNDDSLRVDRELRRAGGQVSLRVIFIVRQGWAEEAEEKGKRN